MVGVTSLNNRRKTKESVPEEQSHVHKKEWVRSKKEPSENIAQQAHIRLRFATPRFLPSVGTSDMRQPLYKNPNPAFRGNVI